MADSILNDRELAKALDPTGQIVTTWTIRKWRLEGKMPFFSVGKRIFFRLDSVLAWIDGKERGRIHESTNSEYGKLRRID